MKTNIKNFFFLTLFVSFFITLPNTASALEKINGVIIKNFPTGDVLLEKTDGEISMKIEGSLTKEGAEKLNGRSSTLMIRLQRITETRKAVALEYSGFFSVDEDYEDDTCDVKGTGSALNPYKQGDKFTCEMSARTDISNLSFGSYVFQIVALNYGLTGVSYSDEIFMMNGRVFDVTKDTVKYKSGINSVGDLSYSVVGGKLIVSGKINKEAASESTILINYNKVESLVAPDGNGTFKYANLTEGSSSTTGGVTSVLVKTIKQPDGTATFSAETGKITVGGDYVFSLISLRGAAGFFNTKWISPFYEFKVEAPASVQIQLIQPINIKGSTPDDVSVNIRIATNKKETDLGQIQLGHVNITGKSGSCVLDKYFTSPEEKSVSKDGADAVLEYTFTKANGYVFSPGVYCIGARTGAMEEFLKFTGKNDWFTLFGAIIPDDFTIDPEANANGCVEGEGGYCLLAPLPGVGDATGRVDVKQGIGNYFNSIIRLVIGIIGVLSVLMIVVGGIQYLSTVAMEEKNNAKRRITHAIFGLIVALGSYSILNTINPNLVNVIIHVPGSGPEQSDMGEEPDPSITDSIPDTITPDENIVLPAGDIAMLAKQILESPKISLNVLNVADANGTITLNGKKNLKLNESYSGPKQQIQDTADGKNARLSSWAENGALKGKTTVLSARMLAGILAVANQFQITVTAVAGGDHSAGSVHYSGLAFDIQSAPSEVSRTKSILKICKAAGAELLMGPCGTNFPYPAKGSSYCAETGGLTNAGHKTHIHCAWDKKSSPEADSDSAESLAGICKSPNPGPSCGEPKVCAPLAAKIDKVVSDDPAMAKFLKGILLAESSCGINLDGPMTKYGQAFGPFQQLVSTAQKYAKACNIKETITAGWLKNPANFEKDVCITRKYVESLRNAGCGSDWRNIAAGYNGGDAGACNPSTICESEKSCINGSTVMRWECPWDSKETPRKANVGYRGTREYSSKIQYCTVTNPPNWIK